MFTVTWRWANCSDIEHSMQLPTWEDCMEFAEWAQQWALTIRVDEIGVI